MKHLFKKNKLTICGAGGGGGSKSPPPSPPPTVTQYPSVLAPPQMGDVNTVSSFSYAELIDLISDGPIEGLVNKNGKKVYEENIFEGIYLNDAPIKETSSTKTQKISIDFLKRALKTFWANNKYIFQYFREGDGYTLPLIKKGNLVVDRNAGRNFYIKIFGDSICLNKESNIYISSNPLRKQLLAYSYNESKLIWEQSFVTGPSAISEQIANKYNITQTLTKTNIRNILNTKYPLLSSTINPSQFERIYVKISDYLVESLSGHATFSNSFAMNDSATIVAVGTPEYAGYFYPRESTGELKYTSTLGGASYVSKNIGKVSIYSYDSVNGFKLKFEIFPYGAELNIHDDITYPDFYQRQIIPNSIFLGDFLFKRTQIRFGRSVAMDATGDTIVVAYYGGIKIYNGEGIEQKRFGIYTLRDLDIDREFYGQYELIGLLEGVSSRGFNIDAIKVCINKDGNRIVLFGYRTIKTYEKLLLNNKYIWTEASTFSIGIDVKYYLGDFSQNGNRIVLYDLTDTLNLKIKTYDFAFNQLGSVITISNTKDSLIDYYSYSGSNKPFRISGDGNRLFIVKKSDINAPTKLTPTIVVYQWNGTEWIIQDALDNNGLNLYNYINFYYLSYYHSYRFPSFYISTDYYGNNIALRTFNHTSGFSQIEVFKYNESYKKPSLFDYDPKEYGSDGFADKVATTIKVGSGKNDIDNINFDSGVEITSYSPRTSAYNFIKLLGGSFDVQSLLEKTFNLSPIQNENIFLTTITIPKFTMFLNKTFDTSEGGADGRYPLKMAVPNLSNYIYFSIGSDSLNSFNYFEMPRSYAENKSLTAAGQKTFLKTLISSNNYHQYDVFNARIFIWSIYSEIEGIKNIDNVLDKYFNNIMIYQNDPSLYNYNLVQAEFKNGSEIQIPLKAFDRIEIENNIGKELIGAFKLTSCKIANATTTNPAIYMGAPRLTNLSANSSSKPTYTNIQESSDDIRYIKAWPVEYDNAGSPYLICNLYANYSLYDKTSASRSSQEAVPITHYIANENVEEVYVTLSLDALYDTAHVDLVQPGQFGDSNKAAQTLAPPPGTKTWAQIQKTDYITNTLKKAYFLIAGPSINNGYIIDRSDDLNCIFCNIKNVTSTNSDYYSAVKSSIGLCSKIDNVDEYITASTDGISNTKYDLSLTSPLICWTVPNQSCYTKESICINAYVSNPDAFETKLKSRNIDGSIAYVYGLSERESLFRNGTSFLTSIPPDKWPTESRPQNISIAEYSYYTAPESELKKRAVVALILNSYIDYSLIFKYWNGGVDKERANTIDNLDILYPNIKKYIVDPFLRYWSSRTSVVFYTQKDGTQDVIKNLYLIGFNKHYLDSQVSYFESSGKLKLSVLDQLIEEYALKTSSGLTNSASIEIESKITDPSFTSGLQESLKKFEGGKLVGFSSVYLFEKVKNLISLTPLASVADLAKISNNRIDVFLFNGGAFNYGFFDPKNIFIINGGYSKVNLNYDVVIFYQLYSNISSNINNPNLDAISYYKGEVGKTTVTQIGSFGSYLQNITAGTRLPAVVKIQVETGYESKEKIFCVGPNEYFKYYFDIFGISTQQSFIDLGRKNYDFVYGDKGSFDAGGYLTKTTNVYYQNRKLYLLKVTFSDGLGTPSIKFFLTDDKNIDFVDLDLKFRLKDEALGIFEIKENDVVIGVKQRIDIDNSIYESEAIEKYNDLIFGLNSNLNEYRIGDLDEGGSLSHSLIVNNLGNSGVKDFALGEGCYVVVGSGGLLATSNNLQTWTTQTSSFGNTGIEKVIYGDNLFVAAGQSGKLATSEDTFTWQQQTTNFLTTGIKALTYGGNCYVIAGASGRLSNSPDAKTWTTQNINWGFTGINTATYGNGIFIIAGQSGKLATSEDANTWSEAVSSFGNTGINCVIYGKNLFLAAGLSGKMATSTNGTDWTQRDSSFGITGICTLSYNGADGSYYAGGISGTLAKSLNGYDWKQDLNFSNQYGRVVNNDVCSILNAQNNMIAGGSLTGKFVLSNSASTSYYFNNEYEEIDLARSQNFLRAKRGNSKQILTDKMLTIENYANSCSEFISNVNNFDTFMVYDCSDENKFIKVQSYNYDYSAFEVVDIPTELQTKEYSPSDYYIAFYFEEFIGYRGNIYQSLYASLERLFPNDVIINLPALETNSSKTRIINQDYNWQKGNFIIRISKTPFDPIGGINEFTVADKNFGGYKTAGNLYSDFKINLSNHINAYLNEELILDKISSKIVNNLSFLTRNVNGKEIRDTLDFESVKNYFKNKNWTFEHKRSDVFFEIFGAVASLFNFTSNNRGAVKHLTASETFKVSSLNLQERASALPVKREPLFFNGSFLVLLNKNNNQISLIINDSNESDKYVNFNNNLENINFYNYIDQGSVISTSISTYFDSNGRVGYVRYTPTNFAYFRINNAALGDAPPQGAAADAFRDIDYGYANGPSESDAAWWGNLHAHTARIGYIYYQFKYVHRAFTWSYLNDGSVVSRDVFMEGRGKAPSNDWRISSINHSRTNLGAGYCYGFVNSVAAYEYYVSASSSYFNPTFKFDAFAGKTRIITENYSRNNILENKGILYDAEDVLKKRGIIKRDMKIKNYTLTPFASQKAKTANQDIEILYFRDVPFSNIDSDSNNTFANDAGLAIKLPAPKYYSDGTPFRRYVKVTKLSYETLSPLISKRVALAKITEIIPQKFSYPFSSMVGMKIDSRAFSQIPTRTFDCKLKKILVPSNYFPNDEDGEDVRYVDGTGKYKIYDGDWDGTFKLMWTNNPAWILMDMLVNKRYGLGNYISSDQIDIWELYKIARWCDGVDDNGYYYGVPDSYGGTEPRHAFNGIITDKFNVFDMINQIASIFRGHVYYMNSMITFDDDRLKPIIGEFNNSDVKDGIFNYTNHKKDDEFTAVEVAYIDEKDNYKPKIEYVEDSDGIRKRGILKKQINAFGVTSKGQARRLGLHFLFQTSKENMNVSFITDMKALLYKPGDLIGINDELLSSYKNFGKVEKIENIDNNKFKIVVSPAICESFLDSSEITLYTPRSKPKYDDILSSVESYPYQLKITTQNLITKKSDNSYVVKEYDFAVTQDKNLINGAYSYTGDIIFDCSINPKCTIVLKSCLSYIKNYDINNNFSTEYGHWKLTTGLSDNTCQDFYLFDSVTDLVLKNTNAKKEYYFPLFDSGKYMKFTGVSLAGQPLYENSGFSMTGNASEPFKICVDSFFGYKNGSISYPQIIENDRPSVENFKIITGCHCVSQNYSELEISKSGWNVQNGNFEKIKESVKNGIDSLVTGSSFSLKIKNLNQPIFKIMSITENYINEYNLLATEYNPQKFKLIEENSSVDDLNNTFNFISAYNSKNNNYSEQALLKAPIFKSLQYFSDLKYGKKYLNIKWAPSNPDPNLLYQIFIQTPSKQTNNLSILNINSKYYNAINNEYEINFDLEKANFEIGTYQVSISSSTQGVTEGAGILSAVFNLGNNNFLNRISNMTSKTVLILEY